MKVYKIEKSVINGKYDAHCSDALISMKDGCPSHPIADLKINQVMLQDGEQMTQVTFSDPISNRGWIGCQRGFFTTPHMSKEEVIEKYKILIEENPLEKSEVKSRNMKWSDKRALEYIAKGY